MEVGHRESRVARPLPAAPRFLGRVTELDALRRFWQSGKWGVLALVARFLHELLPGGPGLMPPDGLLVWSFYQEPDTELFLRTAHEYFGGSAAVGSPARGIGTLHLLRERLEVGGPHLFVLDGDPWSLAWYLRALGELDAAYDQHTLGFFRADLRILQGRLPEVAAEGDSSRTPIAQFLMGRTSELPPETLGGAIPRGELLIYLGRYHDAFKSAQVGRLYRKIGWEGDWARCALVLAEVACLQGDMAQCSRNLQEASEWILRSGSVEHLCRLHRVRARAAQRDGDSHAFVREVEEGLHVARQCGLKLDLIELLCEQAEQLLRNGGADGARTIAAVALHQAAAPDCQFMWGAARAGHILGQAALAQDSRRLARTVLERTLTTRQRIGDPRASDTERLLRQLSGQKT